MADPVPASPKTWADVTNTALHYAAGAAIIVAAIYGAATGLIDKSILTSLLLAAAVGVGFKMGN
jgi:hypothetical protein